MYGQISQKFLATVGVGLVLFLIGTGLIVQSVLRENPEKIIKEEVGKLLVSPTPEVSADPATPSASAVAQSTPVSTGSAVLSESDVQEASRSGVSPSPVRGNRERVRVTRVVDGDTVNLADGRTLRYIGIDTPETVKPGTPVQCFGKEASNKNKELVEGKEVEIEKDVSETDRYGRLLRYVYVGDVMVNQYLVAEGFAYSSSYPPDVKYQEIFREAQKAAQEARKGLWGSCDVDASKKVSAVLGTATGGTAAPATTASVVSTPNQSSAVRTSPPSQSHSSCVIKGNISTSGEKIFHLPGCGSYEKTTINEVQGERWFCNESEAEAAGWRKAKNC